MKIIAVSNFSDECQSDRLVAEGVRSDREAEIIVDALNEKSGARSRDFYKAVPDDHNLYKWEP